MYWTKSFIATLKEAPEAAESVSHQLMLRSGMVRMLISGVYSYLPLGYAVLARIQSIIRDEMNRSGALELLLPALQPLELWQRTNRDELMGETMYRVTDRKGRKLCLGPTHEEVVTDLAASFVKSYRDLPFVLYQIQTKFRDELRPRFGIVRSCEFIMKDAYSFDRDSSGLDAVYEVMRQAYERIFSRCGLDFISVKADSGVIGGDVSHEFMVLAQSGEDILYRCKVCGEMKSPQEAMVDNCPHCQEDLEKLNALEIGHIFKLREKYSSALGVKFLDNEGKQQTVQMGCYGIGVSRLISAVVEQNHDSNGIVWPKEVAPFDIVIVGLSFAQESTQVIGRLHDLLELHGLRVLVDDRDERAGVKFKDADLLGIPIRLTVGNKWTKENKLEVKHRRLSEAVDVNEESVLAVVGDLRQEHK